MFILIHERLNRGTNPCFVGVTVVHLISFSGNLYLEGISGSYSNGGIDNLCVTPPSVCLHPAVVSSSI